MVEQPNVVAHVEGRELPPEDIVVPVEEAVVRPWPVRLLALVIGLFLFVTALGLMKAGATELKDTLDGSVFTDNAWSTLGLGWLGACVVLSGSPMAASALALLEGGAIDRTESFTMLTGSRLGAAFVVLVVGVIYALRNRNQGERRAPLSIGILSLLMTSIVYVPGAIVGYVLLHNGVFDGLDIGTSPSLTSFTDTAFGWAADIMKDVAPDWMLFPVGLGVLLLGFSAFDRALPVVSGDRLEQHSNAWYTRKWPMFLVGLGVTLLTLSVAVSLTLLVPLVAKGVLRRANTLPYIAGANITTLADTLVAAIVLGNQDGVRVVVAVTIAVTIWTLLLLSFAYPLLRRVCLGLARRVLVSHKRLAAFAAGLFVVPIVLIAV
jgi:Na+/phosphate symporter